MDAKTFRSAMGRFATGVTVVTTRTADGVDHGMTANAISSVSLDPPLLLVCVDHNAQAHEHLQAGGFAVNVLGAHQEDLSDRFAHRIKTDDGYQKWPDDRDKFVDLGFSRSPESGAALLDGCLCTIDCTLHDVLPGGDHSVIIGRVVGVEVGAHEPLPLLFYQGGYARLADGEE